MNDARYYTPEEEVELTADELRDSPRETQLNAMRSWFYKNFEHPAERTPYETREGGYQWIWGGPYEASEELQSEFSGFVPDDVIDELVEELNAESWEWGPAESPDDYDDYLFEVIAQQTEASSKFDQAITDIEQLLGLQVQPPASGTLHRLLFVNVISALETYLSDTFISAVANNETLMRRYVESSPEFKGEKVSLSDIYKAREAIESKVKSTLVDIVWHNIGKVKPMYMETLGVKFPEDIGDLNRAIVTRHDIVHRNGKTKDGQDVVITDNIVTTLIQTASALVRDVDAQLPSREE